MVVFPTGFSVDAEAKEISEAGAEPAQSTKTQLLGHAVNDDGTQDALLAGSVAWSPAAAGSALSSVSADGIATAGAVYADTIATFSGAYSGIVAMNSLTVRNVLGDNYGRLAGDTFDDAWEVNKGITDGLKPDELSNGMPNWLLYSMDLNPNSAGGNLVKATPDQDGYLTITYTRNPLAKNCEFTVEEAAEIKDGFTPLANPVSATHTQVNGTLSVTTRGSLPMNAVPKQFLRVRVQRTP
jgi:hypothetical protein